MSVKDDLVGQTGSSLRAQGTRKVFNQIHLGDRFTPAGAGNTIERSLLQILTAVHPCGRREHEVNDPARDVLLGSSLRAQGTPDFSH